MSFIVHAAAQCVHSRRTKAFSLWCHCRRGFSSTIGLQEPSLPASCLIRAMVSVVLRLLHQCNFKKQKRTAYALQQQLSAELHTGVWQHRSEMRYLHSSVHETKQPILVYVSQFLRLTDRQSSDVTQRVKLSKNKTSDVQQP